ncbi:hypothetical protein OAN21_01560 [Alphaproteobacteria bacterium]|nr:hypothetical protein [Alphaproteobacteria bacterium]
MECLPSQEDLSDFGKFCTAYEALKAKDKTADTEISATPGPEMIQAYKALETFVVLNPCYNLFINCRDDAGIQKRNQRWGTSSLPEVLAEEKEGPLLIAVGIAHLGGSEGMLSTISRLVGYGDIHQYVAQADGTFKPHHLQDYSYVDINPETPPEIVAYIKGSQ